MTFAAGVAVSETAEGEGFAAAVGAAVEVGAAVKVGAAGWAAVV